MLNITREKIVELINEYGCPIYLFDEQGFIDNYLDLQKTFQLAYSKYQVSYSYKTNYTPYICLQVKKLGGYAEVVSGMEYNVAKRVGYEDAQIIFNGPNKGQNGVEAVLAGAMVNVDSLDELSRIIHTVKQLEEQYYIGLRVNLDIGQAFVSRFGMDETDISEAFSMVSNVSNLEIVGLHCHISRCRGLEAWKRRTEIMIGLADKYFVSKPPLYIDLGSGMYGQMDDDLAKQFDYVPTYVQYAEVTAGIVADHYNDTPEELRPMLFTEPGTTLINKYIDFIGRVDGIKNIRGKDFIVMNCSEHNLGETCMLKKLPIKVFNTAHGSKSFGNADIVGYTCLEQDVMYTGFEGKTGIGDYIQFGNVGGYSNVYKPPFIWPNCSMVAIDSEGCHKCIKRAETYDDLLHTYMF